MMANVISTPQNNIISNDHKWLDSVVLKNEAVLPD
jgi:hypothetical protein